MAITSVILGILAILLSWIPCLRPIVAVHVLVGGGLGIADVILKTRASQKPAGDDQLRQSRTSVGIAGICLNVFAAILTIVWWAFWETKGFGAFE
jgi:hypothetical protein